MCFLDFVDCEKELLARIAALTAALHLARAIYLAAEAAGLVGTALEFLGARVLLLTNSLFLICVSCCMNDPDCSGARGRDGNLYA